MDIIEFYNTHIIETITITCIIFSFFGGKIRRKIQSKGTKKALAYGSLYKNISALGYAARDNTLDNELKNLRIFFGKNEEYFSHEAKAIYQEIFDRFDKFDTWKSDTQKSIKISEQNSISMKELKDLIINETNYTKYTIDNLLKRHY